MVVDQFGAAVPLGAGIAERADEFLFLGVNADDRCVLDGAALAQFGDVLELVVAVRMRGASTLLVVDPQRESHLLEDSGDGPRADVGTELAQFGGDLGGRATCPLQAAERVAGRLVVHQSFYVGDDFRRFFSVRALPPSRLPVPENGTRASQGARDGALEQWRLAVERARYEAERAERRYRAVEPENRLVARGLETEWEQRLSELEQARSELERRERR